MNKQIYMNDLYNDFITDNPDYAPKAKMTISRTRFYKWVISYAIFRTDHEPIQSRDMQGKWIKIVNKDGKKKEEQPQVADEEFLF